MSNAERALTSTASVSTVDKLCRTAFLKVINQLPRGFLRVKEHGHIVAEVGNSNHELAADIDIFDIRAYRKLLLGGSVAAGESYMDGLWETNDLTAVIRIFARNLETLDAWENKFKWLTMPAYKLSHLLNRNSVAQAKRNIEAHYDLGNDLYTAFLDKSMMYSAAIYPDPNASLAQAQQYKLHTICTKLNLTPQDTLLEIGTGWGGLAIYAAKHFGCHVTTTTISEEQHSYVADLIRREGLDNRITLLKQDYRTLQGQYDKLVSIEMIEAVGKEYLANFFAKCSSLIKEDGLMLLQSITIDDRRYESYANSVDFIQKYIFPGGFLPSQFELNKHIKKHSDLSIRHVQDIGLDYAKTLDDWHSAFQLAKEELREKGYDERFARMWKFYLKYCEGGFLERTISTVQLLLSKPHHLAPVYGS